MVQLVLMALKHACEGNLWTHIPAWLHTFQRALTESPLEAIERVLRYMIEVSKKMPDPETRRLIENAVGDRPLEDAMSYSFPLLVEERKRARQEGRQEGRREGRQEGEQKGLQEGRIGGKRTILIRLLELRFGPLPEPRRTIVDAADEPTLDRWTDHVLTVGTLEELLSD